MKTIDIAQLSTISGGTAPSYRHYVSSLKNPVAIESANLSKGGLLVIRQKDGTTVNLHAAPKGTWMR
jgi:hypothetical protein